jgi:hypothetical protein
VLDIEGLRRDGTRVMLDAALIAILDEAGGLVGITAIMREADFNIVAWWVNRSMSPVGPEPDWADLASCFRS